VESSIGLRLGRGVLLGLCVYGGFALCWVTVMAVGVAWNAWVVPPFQGLPRDVARGAAVVVGLTGMIGRLPMPSGKRRHGEATRSRRRAKAAENHHP
jgi:hypothetical protein